MRLQQPGHDANYLVILAEIRARDFDQQYGSGELQFTYARIRRGFDAGGANEKSREGT
jgi:hypothetical protein